MAGVLRIEKESVLLDVEGEFGPQDCFNTSIGVFYKESGNCIGVINFGWVAPLWKGEYCLKFHGRELYGSNIDKVNEKIEKILNYFGYTLLDE